MGFLLNLIRWGIIIATFYFGIIAVVNFLKKKDWQKNALFAGIGLIISIVLGFINV